MRCGARSDEVENESRRGAVLAPLCIKESEPVANDSLGEGENESQRGAVRTRVKQRMKWNAVRCSLGEG